LLAAVVVVDHLLEVVAQVDFAQEPHFLLPLETITPLP
jgi:hypothetical protein